MSDLGRILVVEDDPRDVELTLTALDEYKLANEVVLARDGKEALDYLSRESRVLVMHSYGIFACFECLADLR